MPVRLCRMTLRIKATALLFGFGDERTIRLGRIQVEKVVRYLACRRWELRAHRALPDVIHPSASSSALQLHGRTDDIRRAFGDHQPAPLVPQASLLDQLPDRTRGVHDCGACRVGGEARQRLQRA